MMWMGLEWGYFVAGAGVRYCVGGAEEGSYWYHSATDCKEMVKVVHALKWVWPTHHFQWVEPEQ